MRRLVVTGVFIEVALLIIGLTWIRSEGREAQATPSNDQADTPYRIYDEGDGNVVEVDLTAMETTQTIAEGVDYQVWTYNGTAPGPVIRIELGDTIRFNLTNASTHSLSHSIDFHAAQTPWDKNYQPVPPGETLTFDWVARFPGVFMYHCGVPPVLQHIANGMYGAIIVEPPDLSPAREYVLVASEFYPGKRPVAGVFEGDLGVMGQADPPYVVFDGGFNRYLDAPLEAKPGEPIRLWVMNAGPTLTNAFHVIGALFDHVYPDGNPTTPQNGLQTYNVPPGAGAMFELTIPDAGLYPFVTHSFAYTGRGSVGVIKVADDVADAPASYPVMADPFTAGVADAKPVPDAGSPSSSSTEEGTTGSTGSTDHNSGSALAVDLSIGGGFVPSELEAKEGETTIDFHNVEAVPHDFTIDDLDVQAVIDPDADASVTFDAPPGVYTFYCSIPGHRDAGMEGTLTVLPGTGH